LENKQRILLVSPFDKGDNLSGHNVKSLVKEADIVLLFKGEAEAVGFFSGYTLAGVYW
jgi:hypothetical protein